MISIDPKYMILTLIHLSIRRNQKSIAGAASPRLEQLPQLNYPILKDTALRKKMSELGIPNSGARALLIRRHTEWVNLWNANCDSFRPRRKGDLLKELELWERTQGGYASNSLNPMSGGNTVMRKDFDGLSWAANHEENFRALIAQALRKPDRRNPEDGKESELLINQVHPDQNIDPVPFGVTNSHNDDFLSSKSILSSQKTTPIINVDPSKGQSIPSASFKKSSSTVLD